MRECFFSIGLISLIKADKESFPVKACIYISFADIISNSRNAPGNPCCEDVCKKPAISHEAILRPSLISLAEWRPEPEVV